MDPSEKTRRGVLSDGHALFSRLDRDVRVFDERGGHENGAAGGKLDDEAEVP